MGCHEERYMIRNEDIDKAKDRAELMKICLKLREFFKAEEQKVSTDPSCKNFSPEQIEKRETLMRCLDFAFGAIEFNLQTAKDTLPIPELKEKMQVIWNDYYLAHPDVDDTHLEDCTSFIKRFQ